jgi:CubicO group peptidase (beta-lactamase class C family)
VTLADLLQMKSGVPDFRVDGGMGDGWRDDRLRGTALSPFDRVSYAAILDKIRTFEALDFPAGTRYAYSNSNYMLLRAVAERVARAPLERLVQRTAKRIAGIDVVAPAFHEGYRQSPSRIVGYDVAPDGAHGVASLSNWDVLGASSVWVSVEDLARWGEDLLAHQRRFTAQSDVGVLRYPDEDHDRGYASGLMTLRRNGELIVYHLGGTEGFSSGFFMRPARGEVMAFSCNMSPELFYARGMAGPNHDQLSRSRDLVFLDVWLSAEPSAGAG